MLKVRYIVAILFFASLLPMTARADHAAGGELVYEWIHDSTYRFYFKFYRDCTGMAAATSVSLCYFNSCGNNNGSVLLLPVVTLPGGAPNGSEVTTGCPGFPSKCTQPGSVIPGYQEYWYTANVTLPSRCNYWTFYISIDTRNQSQNIGNITSNYKLYIETTLDNEHAQGASSPYFSVKPVPYVCINVPNTYNNGAVDPNNDSLGFEFIYPRTMPMSVCYPSYVATDIPFNPGYNINNNPFATNNTFVFNSTTGQMSYTPVALGANTVSLRANKYRNGAKVGSVMRDIQVQTLTCNSSQIAFVPTQTITGAQFVNGRIEACANNKLDFCFTATASSGSATLVAVDNHTLSIPTATVSYTGQQSNLVRGCISWTPAPSDVGLKLLTVTVKDSTCLSPGILSSQTYVIPIYIRSGANTVSSRKICKGDKATLTAIGNPPYSWSVMPGGVSINSLNCVNCKNPVAQPDKTTTYVVTSTAFCNSNINTDTITVYVDSSNSVTIAPADPIILCRPDSVHLQATVTGPNPLSNLSCGVAATTPITQQDSIEILPKGVVAQNSNNPVSTPFNGAYVTARHQYLLRASDILAVGMHSGTLKNLSFKLSTATAGTIYNNVSIALKCTSLTELLTFETGTTQVYNAATVSITSAGNYITFPFSTLYNWDTTQNLIVEICYTNTTTTTTAFTFFANAPYTSTVYAYAASGSVCATPPSSVATARELPLIRFGYYYAPDAPFAFKWSNDTFYPSDTIAIPSVYAAKSNTVYVYTQGRSGCKVYDTVHIHVSDNSYTVTPADATICAGEQVAYHVSNAATYQWFDENFNVPATLSCTNCANPVATPQQNTVYNVVVKDDVNCADTLQVRVVVKPTPQVTILNNDTTIRYGQSIQLMATGADNYIWMPAIGLDNPNIANPVATLTEPMSYVLNGVVNGCTGTDTIQIDINYHENLFVPNAFTPNGDSKNDVFRVANLTYQHVDEFRVFNRWGQEVFNIHDKTGWDGTWKGVPQDMGTYQYLITIIGPNGQRQTFKGEVTLIR